LHKPAAGRYIALVHRHSFQRWTVILLLLSRLVFGEFAHAMPHAGSSLDAPVAAQSAHTAHMHVAQSADEKSHCAEHQGPADRKDAPADHDCCKGSACGCPCMHLPQASFLTLTLSFDRDSTAQPLALDDGIVRHRISTLFRPPA
jgi:hypothetical protein